MALLEMTFTADAFTSYGTSQKMLTNSKPIVFNKETDIDVKLHVNKYVLSGGVRLSGGARAGPPPLKRDPGHGPIWAHMAQYGFICIHMGPGHGRIKPATDKQGMRAYTEGTQKGDYTRPTCMNWTSLDAL